MSKINIIPVQLGLSLGEATSISISVNYTLKTTRVTLEVSAFDKNGAALNVSPIKLDVPPDTIESWAMDFSPVIEWVLQTLNVQENES